MWFHTYDTSGLNRIKQLLVNGSTSCLGINVWGNFDAISQFNNTYCVADKIGSNRGGHAVTIIGYDDTMTTHDGHGAFKLVNSWGPGWGAQGFFWMSYEAVMDHDLSHQAAGFLTDTVGYVPQLLARVRIQHPTRDRVGIQFSVGPRWSALWLKDFRAWRDPAIDWPFPDSKIVFDLTEAAPYITSLQTDSVYFVTWDSRADGQDGSIEHASVQHLDWGTIFASVSTPVQIPDDGSSVTAGMSIRQLDRDVSATCVLAPSGRLEPESSYVPRVEVRNWGTGPATFPVLLTIGAGYADTAQVSGLEPGGAETLAFAPWTVEPRCTVLVRCSTALAADEYTANDTCTALTWARYTDLALEAITVPADTVDSGTMVRPLVRVRNNGTQSELFLVTFKIPDEGYLRSTRTTVSANSDTLVSFAVWLPKNVGSHAMSCTLELAGDMDLSNDTVSGVVVVRAVGIAEAGTRSVQFGLEPPEPSLFRSSVELRFGLPAPAGVSLAIYDATGAVVRRLARGVRAAGVHCLTWDSRDEQGRTVPAGAYFCRLEAGGRRTTAVLLKL
jgi:hypothetical protein